MSRSVLDASALLALLNAEPGSEQVAAAVRAGGIVDAVNLAEIVGKLADVGIAEAVIHDALDPLGLEIVVFDPTTAYLTGMLRPATRQLGLSLGDRACLALAQRLGLPVLTADRTWSGLSAGVEVGVIR